MRQSHHTRSRDQGSSNRTKQCSLERAAERSSDFFDLAFDMMMCVECLHGMRVNAAATASSASEISAHRDAPFAAVSSGIH
jgi:hypothetical protein